MPAVLSDNENNEKVSKRAYKKVSKRARKVFGVVDASGAECIILLIVMYVTVYCWL